MAYTPEQWIKAKGLFEIGYSPEQIADELGFKSRDTVYKRAVKENWEKNKIIQEKSELLDLEKKNSTLLQENSTMLQKISTLEDYQITILQDEVLKTGNKSFLFSTANLSLIRKNQMLTKNTKQVVEYETHYSDDGKPLMKSPKTIEIELSPSDYKAIDEGIDRNAITLEHAPRHANTNIKVDNNNLQQTNLTIEDISLAIANGLPD